LASLIWYIYAENNFMALICGEVSCTDLTAQDTFHYITINSLMERVPIEHLFWKAHYPWLRSRDGGCYNMCVTAKSLTVLLQFQAYVMRRSSRVVCGKCAQIVNQ